MADSVVGQKPTQHCKLIILQLTINWKKKKRISVFSPLWNSQIIWQKHTSHSRGQDTEAPPDCKSLFLFAVPKTALEGCAHILRVPSIHMPQLSLGAFTFPTRREVKYLHAKFYPPQWHMEQDDDLGCKAFNVDQISALSTLRVTAVKPQQITEKEDMSERKKRKSKAERNVDFGNTSSLKNI